MLSEKCLEYVHKEYDTMVNILNNLEMENELPLFDAMNKITIHVKNIKTFVFADMHNKMYGGIK